MTDLLDLIAEAEHTKARSSDPDTSHLAAARAVSRKATDQLLVLRIHAAHPDGLNDFELAECAGRQQTSLGTRCPSLMRAGLLEWTDTYRPSPSGSPSRVRRITPAGRAALAEAAA